MNKVLLFSVEYLIYPGKKGNVGLDNFNFRVVSISSGNQAAREKGT